MASGFVRIASVSGVILVTFEPIMSGAFMRHHMEKCVRENTKPVRVLEENSPFPTSNMSRSLNQPPAVGFAEPLCAKGHNPEPMSMRDFIEW
jgi:hypothetical protein